MNYSVTGKLIDCQMVVGYEIRDNNGKTANVSVEQFEKLIRKGVVSNSNKYGDEYSLSTSYYKELQDKNKKYRIVDKIYSGDNVIGYEVVDKSNDSKILKISLDKAWRLALDDCLDGAIARIVSEYGENKRVIIIDKTLFKIK